MIDDLKMIDDKEVFPDELLIIAFENAVNALRPMGDRLTREEMERGFDEKERIAKEILSRMKRREES